jgi:hypothetical protein
MPAPTIEPEALTPAEQKRVSAVLAAVSTRTLLQSLARLNAHNVDAGLIIAELLDRLPDDPKPAAA